VHEVLVDEVALDAEAPQSGREVEAGPAHRVPEGARGAQSVRLGCRPERHVEILAHQAERPGRGPGADARRFDEHDRNAGRGERRRARAAGQAAANDDNPRVQVGAEPRERRPPAVGKAVGPERC
jgi:hypothetical protein